MHLKKMPGNKGWRLLAACAAAAMLSSASGSLAGEPPRTPTPLAPGGGRITIEAPTPPPPAPLFFTAKAEQNVRLGVAEIAGEIKLTLRIVQGRPEVLTLGLSGDGEVVSVSGAGLRDWAVRRGTGGAAAKRFLDLRPVLTEGQDGPRALELVVRTQLKEPTIPGRLAVLVVTPGDAVGFDSLGRLLPEATLEARLVQASGITVVGNDRSPDDPLEFVSREDAHIEVALVRRGAALADAELTGVRIEGRLNEAARSVDFRLRGQARAERAGARLRVLSGRAGLSDRAAGDGWHIELVRAGDGDAYEIVFERKGVFPIELGFAAAVREDGDWRRLEFQMPAGTVVPVVIGGLADSVEFDPAAAVVLASVAGGWQGFLPADGRAALAWKRTREKSEGTLFFTSTEQTEVRVGAGLLRQASQIAFRVLQGKLNAVRLKLDGPGEIVGVDGTNVLGWKVVAADGGAHELEVRLSRPFESEGTLVVRSQSALGGFPVRAEPLRLTPQGGVRHAGFVRVANDGAVRLEVADAQGMMQLAPAQFPGAAVEAGARQVFVYRFPSADRRYEILANQILPEVGVSELTTYTLGDTDRVIEADLELDVREAPLREWSLAIPADYSVVAVQGADVADYVAESAVQEGARRLKVLFTKPVDGRRLLHVRLEKNEAAAAGEWRLPALVFPEARSVRGYIGVISARGFRIAPGVVQQLAEVPLSYFPKQVAGLQQAFRLRNAGWSAVVTIEALGQSVQADVFHLYLLKQGAVDASVLVNYFVVGAPANEWRIEVPAAAGNIDVTGQGVRRDWRREGNQIVVSLHQPVLGAATLLVTFEEPMSARGGALTPGEVRPLGVQAERGFVQVVSPLQVKHEVRRAEGLLRLEPLELPAELRLFTTAPSLAVYQYTARPFALELGVEWYQPGDTVEQVVDFAQLASRVSRDGQVSTDARFFVKTRGRKALRLQLPEGVKLWEARVDNEVVNARADGSVTLVPLPARLNPNEPVEVALRLGQPASGSPSRVRIAAPKMSAPIAIGEWTVRSDAGRLLVPRGGNAELARPNLTERGFEWMAERGRYGAIVLFALLLLAVLAYRAQADMWRPSGLIASLAAVVFAGVLATQAATERRPNRVAVNYAATVVPADGAVTIDVANVSTWRAMVSWWGVAAVAAGAAAGVAGAWRRSRQHGSAGGLIVAGAVFGSFGLLAQRFGAPLFFSTVAVGAFAFLAVPGFRLTWQAWQRWRAGKADEGAAPDATSAVSLILFAVVLGGAFGGTSALRAAETPEPWMQSGAKAAQAIVQRWDIRDGRLHGEIDLTVRGTAGESFLLLEAPAVLTEFVGDGLRTGKVERAGGAAYFVTPEREGTFTGRAKFELPVPDLTKGVPLLTGPAAVQRITVQLDQGGWEFSSPMAVQVETAANPGEGRSGATLVLGPGGARLIRLAPQQRDVATEATQFFIEAANLYLPGPGVVNGFARMTVRPVQGRVAALDINVPAGFTVGDVGRGPVGAWRFDPEKRRLHVAIEPAQAEAFSFIIETQTGTGALPFDLALRPLRVEGAAGEVGMLALAFGGDAQPEGVKPEGMSAVNAADFDATLLPRGRDRQPLATVQAAFRYSRDEGTVALRVAPVAPEVRVTSKQVLSLGDDRIVLAVDLNVAIARVGLFKLSFALPPGLEVEALSGGALNHWSEAEENGARVVTLHLNGRTVGEQGFALTLVGPAPAAGAGGWRVPKVALREATRQTGELQLVPEKGLRLRATERTNVSELDARALGSAQPGVLAFRLLQEDWSVTLSIEMLEPWVTVQAVQEVTAREGQTLTRLALRYRVENAAVKQVRVRLPGLSDEQTRSARATGPAVSDFVPVPGEPGRWEIRFQRGIIGETAVQIEYQGPTSREQAQEVVTTPIFENTRQVVQFVAVRGGGRLELDAAALPRGWQRVDWSAVPPVLQDRADRSVPSLAFRVAEPEGPLTVAVRRHDVADALKLRVTHGTIATMLAPTGPALTSVELQLQVTDKGTLRVRLPDAAQLFNTFVNGESVSVVRDGDAYLFHVAPSAVANRTAAVRLVYAVTQSHAGRLVLRGPGLNVPLENVAWRVVLPPGYRLADYGGGLRLEEETRAGYFGVDEYRSVTSARRAAEAQQATAFLQQANVLLQHGQQAQAGEVLSRVSNARVVDEATNEDARVQLRELKTQQAIVGLNTRRQRIYLDNSPEAARNDQLEQAANANPFMRGKTEFDPRQVDQILMGNTAEENAALRGIAGRIVEQQLAAEPPPGAIDVTVPQRGRVVTFTRSLQVDGAAPLELDLKLAPERRSGIGFGLGVIAAVGVVGVLALRRRERA
jgi:hypothetical protein